MRSRGIDAKNHICPIMSANSESGSYERCLGPRCAWWTFGTPTDRPHQKFQAALDRHTSEPSAAEKRRRPKGWTWEPGEPNDPDYPPGWREPIGQALDDAPGQCGAVAPR